MPSFTDPLLEQGRRSDTRPLKQTGKRLVDAMGSVDFKCDVLVDGVVVLLGGAVPRLFQLSQNLGSFVKTGEGIATFKDAMW